MDLNASAVEDSPFIGYCYHRPQKRRPLNLAAFPLQVSIKPGLEGRLCLLLFFFVCVCHTPTQSVSNVS